ncbi:MAG: response regulator receiver protein [Firmicutes bacterium]|nr:response regulator receiver protein [Bacillota bacterium]
MSDIEEGIIILDEVSMMRRRIGSLLQGINLQIYEAAYDVELFNILADENANIRLILMDLGFDVNKGFETLGKIKEKRPEIPIFVVTTHNKRPDFIRAMAEGATDYILKPFDDAFLREKILSVLKTKYSVASENISISFNIHNYLNAELKKAKKGKYEITVLMCTLFESGSELHNMIENKYLEAVGRFYKNNKINLWETDVFEQYGSQTFLGVFPYCTAANVDLLHKKIMDYYEEVVKEDKSLSLLNIAMATITYPAEDMEVKELLLTLGMRMNRVVEEMKKEENKTPYEEIKK